MNPAEAGKKTAERQLEMIGKSYKGSYANAVRQTIYQALQSENEDSVWKGYFTLYEVSGTPSAALVLIREALQVIKDLKGEIENSHEVNSVDPD